MVWVQNGYGEQLLGQSRVVPGAVGHRMCWVRRGRLNALGCSCGWVSMAGDRRYAVRAADRHILRAGREARIIARGGRPHDVLTVVCGPWLAGWLRRRAAVKSAGR